MRSSNAPVSVAVLCASVSLSGCVNGGPGQALTPMGYEDNRLRPAVVGCDRAGPLDGMDGEAASGRRQHETSPYCRFVKAYEASFDGTGRDAQLATATLDAGYSYAHTICTAFFDSLAASNQRMNFSRDSVALGGGFVSSVLGLTQTPGDSIALVTAGFTATLAGMESYQQHMLFGPDVNTVRELVIGGQVNYDETVTTAAVRSNLTHDEAVYHITNYQSLCQVDSIQSFVDQAVSNQQIVFETPASDRLRAEIAARPALDSTGRAMGAASISLRQFVMLNYLRASALPSERVYEQVVEPILGPTLVTQLIAQPYAFKSGAVAILVSAVDGGRALLPVDTLTLVDQQVAVLADRIAAAEMADAQKDAETSEASRQAAANAMQAARREAQSSIHNDRATIAEARVVTRNE